ncbi:MAG: IS1634 family transposase [Xanthomonadaceae bacterium]|nr:IS1634 family transposase [Xanthomonadaceae bacterium]
MFTRITRSEGRAYLQLVESFRNEDGKPRQRVVANLGRLDKLTDEALDPLINGLQRALGRDTRTPEVTFDSARAFGDLFALHELWNSLGLDSAIRRALRSSRRQFDATALVRAMVFNRLCEPTSKLGVLRWLETVSLPDAPEEVTHDQLLRTMDALMDRVDAVEAAVARQLRPLLDQSLSVVFYDLTTVRIHGEGVMEDDLRAFGLNKETGGIARQFVLGVIQTAEGLPIAHQVHAGNVGEVSTLLPAIEKAIAAYGIQRVVLVADRGLLSLDNVEAVEALKTPSGQPVEYILAVPARRYADFAETIDGMNFGSGIAEGRWRERCLVVAHDPERAALQTAKRRRALEAIEAEGERMAQRLSDADEGKPLRGRRASDRTAYLRFVEQVKEAGLSRILKADLHADLFSFSRDEAALALAERLDGKLLLITNTPLAPAEVVSRYRALADIERGFRVLKSDIEIAPVHHRLPERIRAHALICFLALVLHRVMRQRLRAAGSKFSPHRALALLRQIQHHCVHINGRPASGVGRLQPEQLELFQALDVTPPETGCPL